MTKTSSAPAKAAGAPQNAPAAWALDTTKPQFFAGGKPVAKVTVEFWNYLEFSASHRDATRAFVEEDGGESWAVFWQRARVLGQMRAWDAAGNQMKVDASDLSLMPARQGIALRHHIDTSSTGIAGAIVVDKKTGKPTGDGFEAPLVYKLGRPLRATVVVNEKSTTVEVSELEFLAKAYGDVEEVCANEGSTEIVPAILRIAKGLVKRHPSGDPDMPLTPDMISQLSFADGDAIYRTVVKHFLEPPQAGAG